MYFNIIRLKYLNVFKRYFHSHVLQQYCNSYNLGDIDRRVRGYKLQREKD